MRLEDFHFDLPDELIARYPASERSHSRLLTVSGISGAIRHRHFHQLPQLLRDGDLLVFNDTRVIPARLFAHKATGGKVEILIERMLGETRALAQLKSNRTPKPGTELILDNNAVVTVGERQANFFELDFSREILGLLEQVGHMPLPPYIDRDDENLDQERYQTVYGVKAGAVAAPTAGLHFDQPLLEQLELRGVETAFVTLHVGAGTFAPVRVDDITEHQMHSEWFEVSRDVVEKVQRTKARGGRVVAVGTTSVRCLESASASGILQSTRGETDIFIYPGYKFKTVDALITNFHLPESTLIMLVSALAGGANIKRAYQSAIDNKYRFFSYGDAMLITDSDLSATGG